MNLNLIAIFIFTRIFYYGNSVSYYEIETNGTKIIGRKLYTVYERKPYVAFWKIPYARRPTRKLRFKVSEIFNHFSPYLLQ